MAKKIETTLKADYLPILDGTNYTNWSGRIKVHLRVKDLWNVCTVPVNPLATEDKKEKYPKSNYEAIAIIIPCLNARCYNKVVNKDTIDTATLLWRKITDQYASHSVVNCGRVFMRWSNLNYGELISYLILGKLLNHDLEQIVNRIALSPDCTEDPYLVLNALQTFQTHKLNQESGNVAAALITSSKKKFPVKVVKLCGFGEHNPEVTWHLEARCFEKYPHLKKVQQQQRNERNASASFAQASAFACFRTSSNKNTFVIDSAALHHMIRDKSLFSNFVPEFISIKTGSSHNNLQALGTGTVTAMIDGKILKLEECLFVPSISQQLVSLVRLISSLVTITKAKDTFSIHDTSGQLFSGAIVDNLLYVSCSKPLPKLANHEDNGLPNFYNARDM
ncbi:hypothetical protein PCASD_14575 [Puccinia coronata f. sp. avenae]|uniref:Uncharacterized protein n=1 Tax=Puccinia coronata f. sp. avenae TaxID=200324 RepID=A0A2N5TBH6_9BASI|nr:hypothetical protein PCASD_14575 [Puccinia coronata f. sp. avenae]